MSKLKTYLVCVSHNNRVKGNLIFSQFINTENQKESNLLFIENGDIECFKIYNKQYGDAGNVKIFYSENSNKSKCINLLINKIPEKEALIICIDDDIKYHSSYTKKYQEVSDKKGVKFFFGGGLIVPDELMNLANEKYKLFYQGSQFTKNDEMFLNSKHTIFFGCNFSFYKSQWESVIGFDERFGPGSKYGIASQESTFQKKLIYKGYKPYFVIQNEVIHLPEESSYNLNQVKKRTTRNGLTHGFQSLLDTKSVFSYSFKNKVSTQVKSILLNIFRGNKIFLLRIYYLLGLMKSVIIYYRIENKDSIYKNL